LAGLDLGEIQHVIDQPEQVLAVALKPFEYAKHLFRRLTVSAIRHQFRIAQDGIERRAQLMAHVGKELRFVLARLLKLPALVLDFVKQSNILDRYHRLVGESRYKLYLLRIEWFYDFSAEKNDANRFSLTQERYAKMRAKAESLRDGRETLRLFSGEILICGLGLHPRGSSVTLMMDMARPGLPALTQHHLSTLSFPD
jgi:hypothetical protein